MSDNWATHASSAASAADSPTAYEKHTCRPHAEVVSILLHCSAHTSVKCSVKSITMAGEHLVWVNCSTCSLAHRRPPESECDRVLRVV